MPQRDRISSLPDEVICHILSFLPTKLAVATSVLSKKWYPLWRSVPTLDFDDEYSRKETYFRFNEFVYSTLLLRDVRQPIKSFRLICRRDNDSNVSKWVNLVLQSSRLENLDLWVLLRIDQPNIPSRTFNLKTLVVLKLSGFRVNDVSSVGLPSLKILHLACLQFPEARILMELLSGCPILEDLLATNLLVRSENPLKSGEFKGLTKLIRADIDRVCMRFPLKAIYNVGFLGLGVDKVHMDFNDIPAFYNLTHMELRFIFYNWGLLAEVLNHCPKLQILEIDEINDRKPLDGYWVCPKFVPECISLHLRSCSIKNYGDLKDELQFARYVMQNARVLRTMEIYSTSKSGSDAKLSMITKLSLCERRSATCQLSFH